MSHIIVGEMVRHLVDFALGGWLESTNTQEELTKTVNTNFRTHREAEPFVTLVSLGWLRNIVGACF
jgi:hypothetical protein